MQYTITANDNRGGKPYVPGTRTTFDTKVSALDFARQWVRQNKHNDDFAGATITVWDAHSYGIKTFGPLK